MECVQDNDEVVLKFVQDTDEALIGCDQDDDQIILECAQDDDEGMLNGDKPTNIEKLTDENKVTEVLLNVLGEMSKTTEVKLNEYEERSTQATLDSSMELKRYIEWELNNALSDMKLELTKMIGEETMKNIKAFAETSTELKRCMETGTENTLNTFKEHSNQICHTFTEVSSALKESIEESQCGKKVSKSADTEFAVAYQHKERIIPSRGNLLTTIETLGKEYHVHFSFTPGISRTGCRNIFHMSSNGNNEQYGDCIPSVNFLSAKQCFSITSAVNGELSHKQNSTMSLPRDTTYEIDISQEYHEGRYYSYRIYLDDVLMYAVLNYDAREFNNVKVYVSDPWNNEQAGYMENLIIKTKVNN